MAVIDDAVKACLEECKDSKAPGVFVEGYFRELARQPGWTAAELEAARRRVLDHLHQSIVARHRAVFPTGISGASLTLSSGLVRA